MAAFRALATFKALRARCASALRWLHSHQRVCWAVPALVPGVIALWGGPALAGSNGQTLSYPSFCYAGACAGSNGTATLYADAIAYSMSFTTNCGGGSPWGMYCGEASFGGFRATGGGGFSVAASGPDGLITAPGGVTGQLTVVEGVEWCGVGGGCFPVAGPVSYGASVATVAPDASLSFAAAATPGQTEVVLDSNLYEAASWTLDRQQLDAGGAVVGTAVHPLSTAGRGGSASWTSTGQAAGSTYRYTATTVAAIAGGRSAAAILFPVAGAPQAEPGNTAVGLSWPAVYGVAAYRVEAQPCASPAQVQPPQGCDAWGAWQPVAGAVQGTSATVTDVAGAPVGPDRLYRFSVTPAMPDGGTAWPEASPDVWTPALPPGAPSASGTATSLTASWSSGGNPAGAWYEVQLSPISAPGTAQVRYTQGGTAVFAGLGCQSEYNLSVAALSGTGSASVPVSLAAETGLCPPAPLVGVRIDGGARSTTVAQVTLQVSASDVSYPQSALRMRLSGDASTWSAWVPFAAQAPWTLEAAGPSQVYVQVSDPGGAVGQAAASIIYAPAEASDRPPTTGATVQFDGVSAVDVGSPRVTAAFTPPAGAVAMRYSLDGVSWSPVQPAGPTVSVVLPAAGGLHPVYDRYQDGQGDPLQTEVDYFVLDTAPPSLRLSWLDGAAATDGGSQTLVVFASDDVSAPGALRVQVTGGAVWSGLLPAGGQIPLTFTAAGYQVVTVTLTDQAGNASSAQLGIYN